ncbi:hypothetical protein BT96DRAFT_994537 [Gymnopus androsaceus JB14]|uniref:Uncharacterized protein n=1 Tax=Gymnopus androsaceus JB14 TaxID=1447944 RepID=A0A6A4HJ33_9AGAR|nr:hypothetical protein BT96DRAFT_994537 [Gymnopus androsaceus JB14]
MYLPGTSFKLQTIYDALWYLVRALIEDKKKKGEDIQALNVTKLLKPPPQPYIKGQDSGTDIKNDSRARTGVFALTIGLDKYLHAGSIIQNLRGGVADADDVRDFLVEVLHVPANNITNLRDAQATAANIVKAFQDLATDTHASDPHPTTKCSISDIKIGQLLENIANAKGNNITVIFDCCYSGSGTRGNGATGGLAFSSRGIKLPSGTKLGSDALQISRGSTVLTKHMNKGLASHVLLAACNELQRAKESDGRGHFTAALISKLRGRAADIHNLTYKDVIQMLPALPRQNPQCEGINQHRILFHNKVIAAKPIYYNLAPPEKDVYTIDVGEASGVTVNAEFSVRATMSADSTLGHLIVDSTSAFSSTLRLADGSESFAIPAGGAFALQTRIGKTQDVRLLVDFTDGLCGVFQALGEHMQAKEAWKPSFNIVSTREEKPDLIITASEGVACFTITDKVCQDSGLYEIPYHPATDSETMSRILRGIADFYWNLHCTTSGNHVLAPKIQFEFKELDFTGEYDDDLEEVMAPVGEIFSKMVSSVLTSLTMAKTQPTSVSPPVAGTGGHIASLAAKGCLTIGYGSGGAQPLAFTLENSQDIDVGYIKLFFSTGYVDYSSVPQKSPFLSERGKGTPKKTRTTWWDTLLVPVIQRRHGTSKVELGQ